MDNFGAVYRKAVWGFVNRLSDTDNHIPNGMFHSELAVTSGIRKAWNGALLIERVFGCTKMISVC